MNVSIALIRSGITQSTQESRFLGKLDEPLVPEGETQIAWKAATGVYPGADMVFSSGLARALQTAQIIYPKMPAIVMGELSPFDYGEFAGKSYMELEREAEFAAWLSDRSATVCPGGEDPYSFTNRCAKGFRKIVGELSQKRLQTAAVITHLSVIKVLLQRYHVPRPIYQDWRVEHAGGFLTEYNGENGSVSILEKF